MFRAPTSSSSSPASAIVAQYPIGPLGGAAVNVTLLSYLGTAYIGINLDPAAITEIDLFVDCIEQGLEAVVRRRSQSAAQPTRGRSDEHRRRGCRRSRARGMRVRHHPRAIGILRRRHRQGGVPPRQVLRRRPDHGRAAPSRSARARSSRRVVVAPRRRRHRARSRRTRGRVPSASRPRCSSRSSRAGSTSTTRW